MKEYKIGSAAVLKLTTTEAGTTELIKCFHEKTDGDLINFYSHISGNGSRMFFFTKGLVLILNGIAYKYKWDKIVFTLSKRKWFKAFLGGKYSIQITDNTKTALRTPEEFNVGRIQMQNGIQGAVYDEKATLAFFEFIKNWQLLLLKKGFSINKHYYIISFKYLNDDYQPKQYHMLYCQENLVLTESNLILINEELNTIRKGDIADMSLISFKGIFSTTKLIKLETKQNKIYFFGAYNQGNSDNDLTTKLLEELRIDLGR